MIRIESLLSARLFLVPQLVGERIYFMSNLSGHLSLYAMDYGGSVPEPLLPPQIALQNPHLIGGLSFYVFEKLGKILVMVDNDGDEHYLPMMIPIEGGYPEPAFGDQMQDLHQVFVGNPDSERNLIAVFAASKSEANNTTFMGNLETGELTELIQSTYGAFPDGVNEGWTKFILNEGYTVGDQVLFYRDLSEDKARVLYGTPIDQRPEDFDASPNGIFGCHFINDDTGLLFLTVLFDDASGLGYLDLNAPDEVKEIKISGVVHTGIGELETLKHLVDDRYVLTYNIDGASWLYEGEFDSSAMEMKLKYVICGQGDLSNGVLESHNYDKASDRHILSFSTATSPTQIYTIEGRDRGTIVMHTRERVLGISDGLLSEGEDASYVSFDGLRVSARLYLPDESLGFEGPRPLVYYVHGGPQSQERPDFAWFSMPLIQFLTLRGFAVFVPNVRGSTGYGMEYVKHVDRDWGGKDMMDHVHAMTEVLPKDKRIDTTRAAVTGRSYGGYMTLMLAGCHPDLWSAACDMFGPYDLFTFMERIPETWKPYFHVALGHPEKDKDFLTERSPRTHIDNLGCPMLVVQGKNDPRVVEAESADLVENLRGKGKDIEYLMFPDEGHDVLKYENRVKVYNEITDFFVKYLKP